MWDTFLKWVKEHEWGLHEALIILWLAIIFL